MTPTKQNPCVALMFNAGLSYGDSPQSDPANPVPNPLERLGHWSEEAVRLAYHLTRDREAALDVSQEAFVKAVEALPSLKELSNGRVWFMQIVVNLCRDWHRRRTIERKAVTEMARTAQRISPCPASGEELEQVRNAMMSLPLDYREVLALVAVESYTCKEAAAVLSLPEGTLRWRLFEARRMVREELDRMKGL